MLDIALEVVRPAVRFLSPALVERITAEARGLLAAPGIRVENETVTALLVAAGAERDAGGRVRLGDALVERALSTAPRTFRLYDRDGAACAEPGSGRTHFTPGSSAVHVLDSDSGAMRLPVTADYVRYARLVDRLEVIDCQSTAFIPSDVPAAVSDCWRLYLSLLHSRKPVVTGAFSAEGLAPMVRLLTAVRGDAAALAERPLAVFSCCPLSPLRWSQATSQNLLDCARLGIPVEIVPPDAPTACVGGEAVVRQTDAPRCAGTKIRPCAFTCGIP